MIKTKRCLFICTRRPLHNKANSGGMQLTAANIELLRQFYDVDVLNTIPDHESMVRRVLRHLRLLLMAWRGCGAGRVAVRWEAKKYDILFIDHSQLGGLARIIRKRFPSACIVTHFHNIESDYFAQMPDLGWLKPFYVRAALSAEHVASKFSSACVFMSENDQARAQMLYSPARTAIIRPGVSVDLKSGGTSCELDGAGEYMLFVGSRFGPNLDALEWLLSASKSWLPYRILVVGKGLEHVRARYEGGNLRIIGTVDSLAPYYANALAVVNPCVRGTGMNIKSIEALGYGKCLLSTELGVRGMPRPLPATVVVCHGREDWLTTPAVGGDSRAYFEAHYSLRARMSQFRALCLSCGI